jgi:hypothetical protein
LVGGNISTISKKIKFINADNRIWRGNFIFDLSDIKQNFLLIIF